MFLDAAFFFKKKGEENWTGRAKMIQIGNGKLAGVLAIIIMEDVGGCISKQLFSMLQRLTIGVGQNDSACVPTKTTNTMLQRTRRPNFLNPSQFHLD